MKNKDHSTKYLKFLFNQTTEKENEALYDHLKEDANARTTFSKTKEVLEAYEKEKTNASFVQEDLKNFERKIRHQKRFSIAKQLMRYAAIIILAIGLVETWHYFAPEEELINYNKVVVARGEQSKIILSDSTEVWLASDTQLEFPDKFGSEIRKVILTGQAFFKVTHNKELPFVVEAGNANIKVLGTEFNVKAYPEDLEIETSLVTGKVNVSILSTSGQSDINRKMNAGEKLTFNKKNRTIVSTSERKQLSKVMRPGEKLTYNKKKGTLVTGNFNPHLELSWREGRLSFRNESFENIAKKLERFYDVEIDFRHDKIKSFKYSGDFDEESIQEALDAIAKITPFKYEKTLRKITIMSE